MMKNSVIISALSLFLLAGSFFASEPIREVADYLWLGTLALAFLLLIAYFLGLVYWVWAKAKRETLIYPDENGNYPMQIGRKTPANPNLTGANDPAWGLWQATNNRSSGSQPRELVKQLQPAPPQILPPIISTAQKAPPILIEARSIGKEM